MLLLHVAHTWLDSAISTWSSIFLSFEELRSSPVLFSQKFAGAGLDGAVCRLPLGIVYASALPLAVGYLWTHAPNQPISSHSIPSRTAYVPKRRRSSRPPVGCSSMWLSALVGGCDALNPMNEAKPENFGPLIVWQVKRFSSCPFAKVGWKIRQRVSPEEGGFASWPGGLGSWSSDPLMTG